MAKKRAEKTQAEQEKRKTQTMKAKKMGAFSGLKLKKKPAEVAPKEAATETAPVVRTVNEKIRDEILQKTAAPTAVAAVKTIKERYSPVSTFLIL